MRQVLRSKKQAARFHAVVLVESLRDSRCEGHKRRGEMYGEKAQTEAPEHACSCAAI
jgi:hypothetical protein